MSNDLISKKAIIDEISYKFGLGDSVISNAIRIIEKHPTAYNVDKVVERLEKERNLMYREDGSLMSSRTNVRIDDAIEIVKSGGVG